ncbi:APC family permease [bacterium]|mgnify:CR=1 FL=1|jgi:basic amino acid/polyamine antiporter, APA family|nr:APC family permease [bacterium]
MSATSNKIGVVTAVIIGMNAMIGSGIFMVPASLAMAAGSTGLITYMFVIFSVWFIALSLARLTQLYPQEGSFYVYAKQWGGHAIGVLSSGAYLVGLLIAMGLLCQMAGIYLHHYFPGINPYHLGLCTLLILTLFNAIGVVFSQAGQYVLIGCTVFPLITATIMCLTKFNHINLIPKTNFSFVNILQAIEPVIFGFFGFECTTSLFSIISKPEKNLSKAVTYSIILVSIIYFIFTVSIIASTPLNLFTDPNIPIPSILAQIFPNSYWIIEGIHLSTLSAVLGTIHSTIWSSSGLLLSLAKLLKNKTTKYIVSKNILNPKTSVFFVGLCILSSFVFLKNIKLFFCFTALFIVFAYLTSMITLLTLKSEWKSKQNIKTIIGILTSLVIIAFAVEGITSELI